MPKIVIRRNIRKEKERFYNFLFNEDYLSRWSHVKKSIYKEYPDLESKLENITSTSEQKDIVDSFIDENYSIHKSKLDKILLKFKSVFNDNGTILLEGLSKLMNYSFPPKAYSIYPSLLPGSTYGKRGFAFLSVVNEIKSNYLELCIDNAVNELNNLWNRKIVEVYTNTGLKYTPRKYYKNSAFKPIKIDKTTIDETIYNELKEIFGPITIKFNQEHLLDIEYDGRSQNINNFFNDLFKIQEHKGKSFDRIMETSEKIIDLIESELIKNRRNFEQYVFTAIHELSHVIWNKKIVEVYESIGLRYDPKKHHKDQRFKPLEGNRKYLINETAHEDLKEIFAPIIIRCEEFDNIKRPKKIDYANPEQQLLNVEYQGRTGNIVDFFNTIFKIEKNKGTSFDDIMAISARVIYSIQDELVKKKRIFDSIGYCEGFEDKLRERGYMNAIIINNIPNVNLDNIFKK